MMYKILIADNQPEWREFSWQVLERLGYQVVLADTVPALDLLLQENSYALILVNAELMFGEFRERIHHLFRMNRDKPIIVVSVPSTTHQTVQDTRTAFKYGARDCVDKPFSGERLVNLVQQLLEEFAGWQVAKQGVHSCS